MNHLLAAKSSLLIFRQVGLVLGNGITVKHLDLFRVLLVIGVSVGERIYDYQNILRRHVLAYFLELVA